MGLRDTARILVMKIVVKMLIEIDKSGNRGIDSETLFLRMQDEISYEDFQLALLKFKSNGYIVSEDIPIMNLHVFKSTLQGKLFLNNYLETV